MTLALAGFSICQADTLVNTDFTRGSHGWMLNGDARLEKTPAGDPVPQVLSLTQNESRQTGTAWTTSKFKVRSFRCIADVRIRFDPAHHSGPADGFTMAFAPVSADTMGGGGGSLGLFYGLDTFTAFEINTWRAQGLAPPDAPAPRMDDKNETFAFDVITPKVKVPARVEGAKPADPSKGGAKIGQILPPKGMKVVNGGWYRYQWDAAADGTMRVSVTGLDDANKRLQNVKVLETRIGFNPIGFAGRFGLTAASGGAAQRTEVARVQIEAPLARPASPQ